MRQHPLKCRISNEGQTTRVDVYDDIGGGLFGGGVSAADFAGALSSVRGALDVHINSGGGVVWDGIAIMNAIKGHKGKVTTIVDGLAASIASVIFQAGHERVVQPGAMLMIHDAFAPFEGNADEMAKMAKTLDQVSDNLAGIYASRAGGSRGEWRALMHEETWFTAEESVSRGLADRVAGVGAELPAGFDLAAYHVPSQIAASLRTLPVKAGQQSCAELGHQCCRDAMAAQNLLRSIVRDELRAADGNHEPMTGSHAHAHPAYGAANHTAHQHDHDGDADHHHEHDLDGDGDNDTSAAGDTDHDHFPANRWYPVLLAADKYNADDRRRMASNGQAMPDGSYPIADEEDLHNAIHAVGRGGSSHDAIRRHIIKRAKALGLSSAIPDNWDASGGNDSSADNRSAARFLALAGRE